MHDKSNTEPTRVVDSAAWLRDRIEHCLADGELTRASRYLQQMSDLAIDRPTRLWAYRTKGIIAFRRGNVDEARRAFERAMDLEPGDPGMAYALGYCSADEGRWWRATVDWLEALLWADDSEDAAEFLRAAGMAVHSLGMPDTALSMLFGALDRDSDNPWVLQSIGYVYEHEEMWLEALGMREALIDVLADGLHRPLDAEAYRNPRFFRLFQAFAVKYDIDRDAIEERCRTITERLRGEIGVVDGAMRDTRDGPDELAPLHLPTGLYELVAALAERDRNFQLLSSAQALWARARHDRFDVHLTPLRLAAAIQRVVERLHWRVPTPTEDLVRHYAIEPDGLEAAARLIIGRFGVSLFDARWDDTALSLADWKRLEQLQQAWLTGNSDDAQGGRMLGD